MLSITYMYNIIYCRAYMYVGLQYSLDRQKCGKMLADAFNYRGEGPRV
jgi:hypothetical protein